MKLAHILLLYFIAVSIMTVYSIPNWNNDETWIAEPIHYFIKDGQFSVLTRNWSASEQQVSYLSAPPLYFFLEIPIVKIMGESLLSYRMISLLSGIGVIMLFAKIYKEHHGEHNNIAYLLLLTAPMFLLQANFARTDMLAIMLVLGSIYYANKNLLASGLLFGLSICAHLNTAVFLPSIIYLSLSAKMPCASTDSKSLSNCVKFAVALFIGIAPLIAYISINPGAYAEQMSVYSNRASIFELEFYVKSFMKLSQWLGQNYFKANAIPFFATAGIAGASIYGKKLNRMQRASLLAILMFYIFVSAGVVRYILYIFVFMLFLIPPAKSGIKRGLFIAIIAINIITLTGLGAVFASRSTAVMNFVDKCELNIGNRPLQGEIIAWIYMNDENKRKLKIYPQENSVIVDCNFFSGVNPSGKTVNCSYKEKLLGNECALYN